MKLSGAVFDFDGTLFDIMSVWDTAGEDYLKQCGKVPRENLCEVLKPKGLSGAARISQEKLRFTLICKRNSRRRKRNGGRLLVCEAQPKNGVREF